MRAKIFNILNKVYSITMAIAFFGGIIPLVPFLIALCIGGTAGESISIFLYKQYYPWVIALASIAVCIGVIAMYVGGKKGLSVKSIQADDKAAKEKKGN